jgi:hypothetical protein
VLEDLVVAPVDIQEQGDRLNACSAKVESLRRFL